MLSALQESTCFSIVYKHPKFVCKSIDFVCEHAEARSLWLNALRLLLSRKPRDPVSFNEKLWLARNFQQADLNKNGRQGNKLDRVTVPQARSRSPSCGNCSSS